MVVTNKAALDAATIATLTQSLRLIAITATGYNMVDMEAADAAGVTVCNVPRVR